MQPGEGVRQALAPAEREGEAAGGREDHRHQRQQDRGGAGADRDAQDVDRAAGQRALEGDDERGERGRDPGVDPGAGPRRAGADGDRRQRDLHRQHRGQAGEEGAREPAAGPARLAREARDRLDAGEGQDGQRQREGDVAPARVRRAAGQVAPGQQHQADPGDRQVHRDRQRRDPDRHQVQARAPHHPRGAHDQDHAGGDGRARAVPGRVGPGGGPEVGRQDRGRQRQQQELVEQHEPAGAEPGGVAEGAAHEGRRAAGLGHQGHALAVAERHHDHHGADREHDPRGRAARARQQRADRQERRRAGAAVGERGEVGRAEVALEAEAPRGHGRRRAR